MCSGVTASSTMSPALARCLVRRLELASRARGCGRRRARRPWRGRRCAARVSSSARAWSSCSLSLSAAASFSFSAFQRWVSAADCSSRSASSFSSRASRSFEALVGLLLQRLALDLELDDAPVELVELLGLGIDLHAQPRRRLVDQVDRLVGQEAVGDVAVATASPRRRAPIGDAHAVVQLVLLLEAAQDRDRCPRPSARRRRPAGSAARAPRPSRRTCGTRRAWSRRRSAARRAPAPASAGWRRPSRLPPCRRRPACASRR